MKYRINPKNNTELSLLGFGAMRLPQGENGQTDIEESKRIIRHAIDSGVNYIDTAYVYIDQKCEGIVGKILEDGYREKVSVATKLPLWMLKAPEDVETIYNTSAERLGVDCIDYYLAHDINDGSIDLVKKFNVAEEMQKLKDAGKIKNLGFSFHGTTTEFFKEVVDYYDWDFCQIQLNYMDAEYQAGVEGLKYAASKGLPVIIMEPVRGGRLSEVIPGPIQSYWDSAPVKRTPAEWALRWVANFPEVTTILSGMNTMAQVEENLKTLSDAEANSLTQEELEIIQKVADEYNSRIPYGCTECKYCMPCPAELEIPRIITHRNEAAMYEAIDNLKGTYGFFFEHKASECLDCKECEGKCPQHLPIAQIMKECVEIFED